MDRRNYEKATAILMILTIFFLFVALICSCILQKLMPRFYWISPILAFIASMFLLVSIFIYSIYTEKYFMPSLFVSAPTEVSSINNNVAIENKFLIERGIPYYFGYSFWFAFAALITTLIAAIIGFMASKNFGEETTSRFLVQSYITSAIK
uniref:NADH dehydrogenase subunit 6 n=1 Tax=Panagrolaimus sp. PS1159 TaxID=55785 RepID=A0AC35GQT8_9BILA